MNAGKVLAVGTAAELTRQRGKATLEDAFIAYLQAASEAGAEKKPGVAPEPVVNAKRAGARKAALIDLRHLWAYARREAMEILRDPIRLTFSLLGPILLLVAFGYGISFDVDNLAFAAFDQDRTLESLQLIEDFSGSRYFQEHRDITSVDELQQRLRSGELKLALEIPPHFGKDLSNTKTPEIAIWLDGAMPFVGETARGYVTGLIHSYMTEQIARGRIAEQQSLVNVETRFRYNQSFESVYAMVPGAIMILLMLIPAMMTAISVVREKETGSIANFRSTPITTLEFLLGKQLPYVAIALVSFLSLLLLAVFVFQVPVKGSITTLLTGVVIYVCASTGFGLLISSFTQTQIAATVGTAILTVVPAVNFSGLVTPVSTLTGGARIVGLFFPAGWFQQISVGTFTKGLGIAELWPCILALAGFTFTFIAVAALALKKQEA
jgi:ribosome-dependent ATPase